ncbi:class II aldolase/adducin family protein [Sphingomonas sp. R647]|uniref:class II aldolase/adducin family protein n=1 Tax=Sphingomonas sp. R647 TaxID=2875233 RepID=UPI001CD6BC9A|nr:class II aldolase/adducin family protein [Sphingomonas sp. R647]MCA1196476.1 class II aldolase/adducin family protein [Sphingomonas sp. R647]
MVDDNLSALRASAAEWGRDPTLVQGAGGNVSIKLDDVMWIKASGTWLADAAGQDILVPVALPVGDVPRVKDGYATALRPSIETLVHAALPHRVVVHVHSVDAIAHAVRCDAEAVLSQRLSGLAWVFVPYCKPGPKLAAAVQHAHAATSVDIFILANHGLIVAADDVGQADTLLREVVSRLSIGPRPPVAPPGTPSATSIAGFRAVSDPHVISLAVDPTSLAVVTGGPLYPDHVVFLGRAPLVVDSHDEIDAALADVCRNHRSPIRWIIVRGSAVLLAHDALRGSEAMLRCLADVATRIPPGAPIAPLCAADVDALIDWDAERYRQAMATPAPRSTML